jgi:UDP-N-acetyl-D-mannosaminuronic acid dehydrogenase
VEPFVSALPSVLADRHNLRLVKIDEAMAKADVVGVLVRHSLFKTIDPSHLGKKAVIDAVGLFSQFLIEG